MQENAASSENEEEWIGEKTRKFRVESDSFLIWVDNHYSTHKTNNYNHSIGIIIPIKNGVVKLYGVVIKARGEEKVKKKIEYHDGKVHYINIHNVNCLPEATICLLSPHQWYQ